jgi:hypothetical protein
MAENAAGKGQQTTQQPFIDRSVRGAVTLAQAAAIVTAEARVPPPPLLTAVVVDGGGGGMEPTAPMAALLTAVAVDVGGSNGIVATAIDDNNNGGGGDGDNYGYDQPFAGGSLQPIPLGGAVGRDVCLTVVSNGIVGLGIGLLVIRLLISGAVGRDVGLMVVGDGIVGLGKNCLSADRSTLGSFLLTNV